MKIIAVKAGLQGVVFGRRAQHRLGKLSAADEAFAVAVEGIFVPSVCRGSADEGKQARLSENGLVTLRGADIKIRQAPRVIQIKAVARGKFLRFTGWRYARLQALQLIRQQA